MNFLLRRSILPSLKRTVRCFCTPYAFSEPFEQGQSPGGKVREYFYYIDHQGQLFLEGTKIQNFTTCYKDLNFLVFFFKRVKINETERYRNDFPYVSPCGKEMNYIRCESLPIVFTDIIQGEDTGEAGSIVVNGIGPRLSYPFEPEKLCMLPKNGRVYHPAPLKVGGAGILKTSLCIDFSSYFSYKHGGDEETPPSHFQWDGVEYELTNELWDVLQKENVEIEEED